MTKAEIKFIRALFKSEISDEEAVQLFERAMILADEIRREFRQIHDPEERP